MKRIYSILVENRAGVLNKVAGLFSRRAYNIESLAVSFLAVNFGFVFFKASFGDGLTALQSKEYIESSVRTFVNGIGK